MGLKYGTTRQPNIQYDKLPPKHLPPNRHRTLPLQHRNAHRKTNVRPRTTTRNRPQSRRTHSRTSCRTNPHPEINRIRPQRLRHRLHAKRNTPTLGNLPQRRSKLTLHRLGQTTIRSHLRPSHHTNKEYACSPHQALRSIWP